MYHRIYNLSSKGQCKNFHQEAKTAQQRATLPKGKQVLFKWFPNHHNNMSSNLQK
jgi:hypothetical protein